MRFAVRGEVGIPWWQRLWIVKQLYVVSYHVEHVHAQEEIIAFIEAILSIPKEVQGCIVEAGSFKGGNTAKISIVAKMANRELVVFDSFEGIPDNREAHDKNIRGGKAKFSGGDYRGTLEEVQRNVTRYGSIDCCRFVKGWFEETMPSFKEPVAAAYLDVDLALSTRTCLKYLYPLLVPGGLLYSQDGHLPLVLEVFGDEEFWRKEVGYPRPEVERLGERLIRVAKPLAGGL